MTRAPVASRLLLAVAVLVAAFVDGACEVVPPVNPFDPATRPEDQAVAVIDGTLHHKRGIKLPEGFGRKGQAGHHAGLAGHHGQPGLLALRNTEARGDVARQAEILGQSQPDGVLHEIGRQQGGPRSDHARSPLRAR